MKRRYLIPVAAVLLLASILAVERHRLPDGVPLAVLHLLAGFQGPGNFVWFVTLGCVFCSGPRSPLEHAIAIVANVIFWLAVAWLIAVVAQLARRWLARPRR